MSWSQNYDVPSLTELASKLMGKPVSMDEILLDILYRKGFVLKGKEKVTLVDGDMFMEDLVVEKYTFLNLDTNETKTFIPVLVKSVTEDGNYGMDEYAWWEEGTPLPKVTYTCDGREYDPQTPVPDTSGNIETELL